MSSRTGVASPDLQRSIDEVATALLARRTGYVPTWGGALGDPGRALLRAEAAMLASLWERLNQVPDKYKLVFLSELGIDSLPPAAARAPIQFEPLPLAANSTVPEGSLVGAPGPDGDQITFQTEHGIGVAASRLAEVRSVVPSRDGIAEHTVEVLGQRPFEVFTGLEATQRYLYIGHRELLAVRGEAMITLEFELARDATVPLQTTWSIWDGAVWREYRSEDVTDLTDTGVEATETFGRSGTISLRSSCVESATTEVDGIEACWVRAELTTPLDGDDALGLPEIDQIRLAVELGGLGNPVVFPVTSAQAEGQPVDVTSAFYPFGQAPDRTSIFYIDAAEPSATDLERLTLTYFVEHPRGRVGRNLDLEYWNGDGWQLIRQVVLTADDITPDTLGAGHFEFDRPPNWAESDVDGVPGTWLRLRLAAGERYVDVETIAVPEPDGEGGTFNIDIEQQRPPMLSELQFEVSGRSLATSAHHVLSFDGALHNDHSEIAQWRGAPFPPFAGRDDTAPALYLGFDGPLPAANLGLYIEIDSTGHDGPAEHEFRWERFNGTTWTSLPVEDETDHLTATGIIRLLWPGNRQLRNVIPVVGAGRVLTTQSTELASTFVVGETVYLREGENGELATIAAVEGPTIHLRKPLENSYQSAIASEPEPPLFGMPRTWIRARLAGTAVLPRIVIDRLLRNVTWASHQRRIDNENLGSGNGQPNQRLFSTLSPFLGDSIVEVRELSGARARTDVPILERELAGTPHSITIDRDVDGDPVAAWVRWTVQTNFASSQPDDRHCIVDRVRGVVRFGDDRQGRSLPTGSQNVRLSTDVGGGAFGNVEAEAVTNPLSGMVVASVENPVAATGGADAESAARARARAPQVVRHRYQAVTAADWRSVALEASPEVFDAAVVAIADDLGGRLQLHVLPASTAQEPAPSAQLIEGVERHLARRCPAGAAPVLSVRAPVFVPIGVDVSLAALPGQAELVLDAVHSALRQFLHPVVGGPGSVLTQEPLTAGWCFGATVHTARFAELLENVEGVDYVESFSLLQDGAIAGDEIQLEPDAVPVAGTVTVKLVRERGR